MSTSTPTQSHDHGFTLRRRTSTPWWITAVSLLLSATFLVLWLQERAAPAATASTGSSAAVDRPLKVHFEPAMAGEEKILEHVAEHIAPDHGVSIEPVGLQDPVQANRAVAEGQYDATIFEHQWYMQQTADANGFELTPLTELYQWGFGLYSDGHGSVEELPAGATVLVPDDAANQGQALWLLQREGLLELDPAVEPRTAKIADVVGNPNEWELREMDLLSMPRVLDSVDAAIGYVSQFDAGKVSRDKGILFPEAPRTFASRLVVSNGSQDTPETRKLVEVFSDERLDEYLRTTEDPLVKGVLTPVSPD